MKKNFKQLAAVTASGASVTLVNNGVNDFYQIAGDDVTLTAGYAIGINFATKDCVIKIYVAQNITIGTGGSITILGKAVTESLLEGVMLECIYNGTDWDIYRMQSADYQQVYSIKPYPHVIEIVPTILTGSSVTQQYPTIADAHTFIATEGTATADNHWTLRLPSGYVNEDVVGMAYVDYQGVSGTRLKSFTSGAAYTSANERDSIVSNCIIDSVNVAQAKAVTFKDCFIKNYAPVSAASTGYVDMQRCTVNQGDFSNTDSSQVWQSNKFIAKTGNILLAGMTNKIKDCVINEDSNSITLPTLLENCSIDIDAITISTATTIIGGQLNATAITGNADLTLVALSTDAIIAMSTGTELNTPATSTGAVTLAGTATKASGDNIWNGGVATDPTATAWNNGTASESSSTAWNGGTASGDHSTAWSSGTASGVLSTAWNEGTASGDGATAWNYGNAIGDRSTAWSNGIASGVLSTAWNGGTASGDRSTAWSNGTASGVLSTAWRGSTASGDISTAWNYGAAIGSNSTAWNGGNASGFSSTAFGNGVNANSYAETVFGQYGENTAATSDTSWDTSDKLWSIANGTDASNLNDTLVMKKDGTTTVDAKWTFEDLINIKSRAALPDVGDSTLGDIVVLDAGTIHFFDGTAWKTITIA